LLTPERCQALIVAANRYVVEQAGRCGDGSEAKGLESEIRRVVTLRNRLIALAEGADSTDLGSVRDRIGQHERKLKELRGRLSDSNTRAAVPPQAIKRINAAEAAKLAADLRELLNQDVKAVAPLLKQLTGPIAIEQIQEPGKKKPTWVAHFTANVVPVMLRLAASKKCPTSSVWEYLQTAGWKLPIKAKVPLNGTHKYEKCTPAVKRMVDAKASVNTIAGALGVPWLTAKTMVDSVKTGLPPVWQKPGRKTGTGIGKSRKFADIATDVANLKSQRMTVAKIISWLAENRGINVSEHTVRRAWDSAHQEEVRRAAHKGVRPYGRACFTRITMAVKNKIRSMLQTHRPIDVAKAVGCSVNTVYREMQPPKKR
jgi:hypothetical protein